MVVHFWWCASSSNDDDEDVLLPEPWTSIWSDLSSALGGKHVMAGIHGACKEVYGRAAKGLAVTEVQEAHVDGSVWIRSKASLFLCWVLFHSSIFVSVLFRWDLRSVSFYFYYFDFLEGTHFLCNIFFLFFFYVRSFSVYSWFLCCSFWMQPSDWIDVLFYAFFFFSLL